MSKFIEVPYGNEDVIINISEIVSITSSNKSVIINLTSGKAYTLKTTLESFREILKPLKIDAERVTGSISVSFIG